MDRRGLHKFAVVGGGLVLLAAAVLVLRDPDPGHSDEAEPLPPPRTSVQSYAHDSVVVPQPGARPKPPQRLEIMASEHRLVVGWGPRHIGAPEPEGAAGYEVRWGARRLERTRLVATPVIQLDGLENDVRHHVEVRTVDAFGRRSEPVRASAMPWAGTIDPTRYTFVDRFDGRTVPDPVRWRLVGIGSCAKASRGAGDDRDRLVVTGQCGSSDEVATLRARAPLRLLDPAAAPNGELGRLIVETDRPGQSGELMLDLVPGPVDLIGRPGQQNPAGTPSGQATVDDSLPPGTIRVVITGARDRGAARVLVAPGTPLLGRPIAVTAFPPPEIGVSVRWEVVLRTDGVQVLRDGAVVAAGDVVPSFTEATALIGFTGGEAGLRAGVELIGFTGAPTTPPPLLPAPRVDFERSVAPPGSRLQTTATGYRELNVRSGQLRITLFPEREPADNQYTVDIAGREFPLRPAIPGQPARAFTRLPFVADLPPEALVVRDGEIPIAVRAAVAEGGQATQVLTASLELDGEPAPGGPSRAVEPPLPRANATLPTPEVTLLDAAGTPIQARQPVARGRLVLDVRLDPHGPQRTTGEVAGLAGVEITIDGTPLAAIDTATDGPGVGGHWRIAVDTKDLPPGGHTVQVSGVGAEPITAPTVSYASFVIG